MDSFHGFIPYCDCETSELKGNTNSVLLRKILQDAYVLLCVYTYKFWPMHVVFCEFFLQN